jgi:hypothetical protein
LTSNSMLPHCTWSTCLSPRRTRCLFDPSPPPRELGMLSQIYSLGMQAFKSPSLMKQTIGRITLPCLIVKILNNTIGISQLLKWS